MSISKIILHAIRNKKGIGVIEIVLILVVLITLVLIFKDQLLKLINDIFSQISSSSSTVY